MNKFIRNIFKVMLVVLVGFILTACGNGGGNTESDSNIEENETTSENSSDSDSDSENVSAEENDLESTTIKWGRGNSGNILVSIAKREGYFAEEGIEEVEEVNLQVGSDALTLLTSGDVDILSNFGTPVQQVANGNDITFWGGFMMEGAMPIVAQAGTEFNGASDLVGKKVAGNPLSSSASVSRGLVREGYNPVEDVEWVNIEKDSDKLAATSSGEVDYAIVGTDQNYGISQMGDVEIVAYTDDITDNYSCCRIESRTDWLEENPNTARAVMRALIRAQADYEGNREEAVDIMIEELDADREYVEAYMLNDHYTIHLDPLSDQISVIWDMLGGMDYFPEGWEDININDHINTEIYKTALDEVQEEYGDENPEFYEEMQSFHEEQNDGEQEI